MMVCSLVYELECAECGAESGERCRVDCTGYSVEIGELE